MSPQFKPHQQFAFDWLQPRPRAIFAMQQRLGKTPVAAMDIVPPANILCPAFLKIQWRNELAVWRPDLSVRILYPGERAIANPADVWITNYEILQDVQLAAAPHLVADEAHYCKHYEAKRTITTLALADCAKRVRWLTGTVMPNRSMELYPALYATRVSRMTPIDFGIRYAGGYQDEYDQWQFRGNTHSDELKEKVDKVLLRITRDQIGMPENDWIVIALDLPVDKRERAYNLQAIARSETPVNFEGLSELLHKQSELKLPLCLDYIRNVLTEERPLLVFAWHKDIIEAAAMALTGGGFRVRTIDGTTPHAERYEIAAAFERGELDVVIGNRKAAGVGLPLHAAERVIFIEAGWSPLDNEQAADRGVSMERWRSLRVDLLTVSGSIDEYMVRRCLEKEAVIDRVITPNEEFSQWQSQNPTPQILRKFLLLPFQR